MNLMLLSATQVGCMPQRNCVANEKLRTVAKLLGLDGYSVEELCPDHGPAFLFPFKTDHEKHVGFRLAHMFKQPTIYVVENIAIRNGVLYGTGGRLMACGTADYTGAHDDVRLILNTLPTLTVDEVQLPAELGGFYLSFE